MRNEHWLLPEGIDEILPPQAMALERLRRELLDLYASWGYELVFPPLIEYLESLLTGTGGDLDLQTFKLIDQITGRTLGIRADITPQAARIDAHQLRRDCPTRLCYLGTVLNTRSGGLVASRSPLQTGAELYGHAGVECWIRCSFQASKISIWIWGTSAFSAGWRARQAWRGATRWLCSTRCSARRFPSSRP